MTIAKRYQALLNRRMPVEDRIVAKFAAEAFEREPGEATRYLLGGMRPVDSKYTARLRGEGDRVEKQLAERLKDRYPGLEFRRQGSVSNDTHIKYWSDVDVLTIIDKFVTLEHPQQATNLYRGDPIDDLAVLKSECVKELKIAYPAVDVDGTGSMAISMTGGSLHCKVDVVPSNWFDTNTYAVSRAEHNRGIQVLNRETRQRVANYPFLYNHRVNEHDRTHFGFPRMLMRLLKTVRADLGEEGTSVGCSSFDLCSLVYRMPDQYFKVPYNQPLQLVGNLLAWLRVSVRDDFRAVLKAVDDSRLIYKDQGVVSGVNSVTRELDGTYQTAKTEVGTLTYLSEAHAR